MREQTVLAHFFLAAGKSIQSSWAVTCRKSGVLFGDVVCGKEDEHQPFFVKVYAVNTEMQQTLNLTLVWSCILIDFIYCDNRNR